MLVSKKANQLEQIKKALQKAADDFGKLSSGIEGTLEQAIEVIDYSQQVTEVLEKVITAYNNHKEKTKLAIQNQMKTNLGLLDWESEAELQDAIEEAGMVLKSSPEIEFPTAAYLAS